MEMKHDVYSNYVIMKTFVPELVLLDYRSKIMRMPTFYISTMVDVILLRLQSSDFTLPRNKIFSHAWLSIIIQ